MQSTSIREQVPERIPRTTLLLNVHVDFQNMIVANVENFKHIEGRWKGLQEENVVCLFLKRIPDRVKHGYVIDS